MADIQWTSGKARLQLGSGSPYDVKWKEGKNMVYHKYIVTVPGILIPVAMKHFRNQGIN